MPRMKPCPECESHLKVTETACPFCGTELGGNWNALKALPKRGRLSRSAAVAMATTLAASACASDAEESPPIDNTVMPVYGAPVLADDAGSNPTPGTGGAGGTTTTPAGGGSSSDGGAQGDAGAGVDPTPVPVYGAPIADDADAGAEKDASASSDKDADPGLEGDAGADSADSGAGFDPTPVPVYGIPVPLYGIPVPDDLK